MGRERTFDSITLALHGPPNFIQRLPNWLLLEAPPVHEHRRGRKQAAGEVYFPFGRRGLRRIMAPHLVSQFKLMGFFISSLMLQRERAIFSKKDVRHAAYLGRKGLRIGDPKNDERGRPVWQESIQFGFTRERGGPIAREVSSRLEALLQASTWQKGQVFEAYLTQPAVTYACVELVMPRVYKGEAVTELSFTELTGFQSRKPPPEKKPDKLQSP